MNITCPINKNDDIKKLIKAGAKEFYAGIVDKKWRKRYGLIASGNRRYFKESNFNDVKELKKFAGIAKRNNARIFFVINSHYYLDEQYKEIIKQIKDALDMGIDSFIVADLGLLLKIKELKSKDNAFKKIRICISTGGTTFNSETVKFYKEFGAERIILPRHLRKDEIENIVKKCRKLNMEFETFMLYDFCKNVDGFCTSHHGMEDLLGLEHLCTQVNLYRLLNRDVKNDLKRIINNRFKCIDINMFCGACFLPEFKKIGVTAVKIAGRRFSTDVKEKAVEFVKKAMKLKDKEEIKELYEEYYGKCPDVCNCYG